MLSLSTVKRNLDLEARVNELELEISVWKQAHSVAIEASERESTAHKVQIATLNRQIANLDSFRGVGPVCFTRNCPDYHPLPEPIPFDPLCDQWN